MQNGFICFFFSIALRIITFSSSDILTNLVAVFTDYFDEVEYFDKQVISMWRKNLTQNVLLIRFDLCKRQPLKRCEEIKQTVLIKLLKMSGTVSFNEVDW